MSYYVRCFVLFDNTITGTLRFDRTWCITWTRLRPDYTPPSTINKLNINNLPFYDGHLLRLIPMTARHNTDTPHGPIDSRRLPVRPRSTPTPLGTVSAHLTSARVANLYPFFKSYLTLGRTFC